VLKVQSTPTREGALSLNPLLQGRLRGSLGLRLGSGARELACGRQAFIATWLFDPSMSALPIMLKQNSASVGLFTLLRERELGIPKPNSWYALAVASFAQEVGRGARKASLTQCLGVCQTVRGSPKATSTNPVGES
jgi:hypothetical protein